MYKQQLHPTLSGVKRKLEPAVSGVFEQSGRRRKIEQARLADEEPGTTPTEYAESYAGTTEGLAHTSHDTRPLETVLIELVRRNRALEASRAMVVELEGWCELGRKAIKDNQKYIADLEGDDIDPEERAAELADAEAKIE